MIIINANLPAYADYIGLKTEIIGWIVSLNPLVCLIFSFPFAHIGDKYNRFLVIFIGLLFYFFAALILVFFKNIEGLVIVKILEGLALAAFLPAVMAFRIDIGQKENISQNIGSLTSVVCIGYLVGPAMAALIGKLYGLEAIFVFVFICSTLSLLMFIKVYLLYKKEKVENVEQFATYKQTITTIKPDYKSFNWPVIITISLLSFAYGYAISLYDTVWAYYLFDLGGNVFILNLSYCCFALPVVLLSKPMGKLADKYENLHIPIMVGSFIIAFAIFSYGIIPYALLIAFMCSLEGVGTAAMYPCINAAIVKAADDNFRGRALGIFTSARMAGSFIGAIITGYLFSIMTILPFAFNALVILLTAILASVCVYKYKLK